MKAKSKCWSDPTVPMEGAAKAGLDSTGYDPN